MNYLLRPPDTLTSATSFRFRFPNTNYLPAYLSFTLFMMIAVPFLNTAAELVCPGNVIV